MAQFARPIQDISINSWRTQSGESTNLWQSLDEETADDITTYIVSSISNNTVYETLLSPVTAALIDRLHILRYRGRKNQAAGNARGVQVDLLQGSTIIATNSHPDLTVVWADGAILLTKEQGAAITDYTDLRVRFTPLGSTGGGSSRRSIQMSWVQLRVPDWQPTHENDWGADEDLSTPGVFRYILSNKIAEGSTREDALFRLIEQLGPEVDGPADPLWMRRYELIYSLRKLKRCLERHALIEASSADTIWEEDYTRDQALAIFASKIAHHQSRIVVLDSGDRV